MALPTKIFVNQLQEGHSVHTCFAVTTKNLREYAKGKFLSLRLADRSGKINAVMWDQAETAAQGFAENDLVVVKGQVTSYNGELQITVASIRKVGDPAQCSPRDFLPAAPVPVDQLIQEMDEQIAWVEDPDYQNLLQVFRHDPVVWEAFTMAPGAKRWHHPYLHGLLHHTLTVVKECAAIAGFYPRIHKDLLVTGAIFHDLGKTTEFEYQYTFDYSTEGRLKGHIFIGANRVEKWIDSLEGFPDEKRNRLIHIILSHHGEVERSPVLPMTMEAALLHHVENMDAQLTAFERELHRAEQGQMEWTSYIRLIDRVLYRGESTSVAQSDDVPF